jgi:hypothetical protein
MAEMNMDDTIQEYIIALHAINLLNMFMSSVMGGPLDSFGKDLAMVSNRFEAERQREPRENDKIILLFSEVIAIIAKLRKAQAYQIHIAGRYIEIIAEKWMRVFLNDRFYTSQNKEFYLEESKTILNPFYARTYQYVTGRIISFVEAVEGLMSTPNVPDQVIIESQLLKTEASKLIRYFNFFESILLRVGLVIYQKASIHGLNVDGKFDELLKASFEFTEEIPMRTRLASIEDDKDVVIWRYMSLPKFLFLLTECKLFIPSVRLLRTTSNDPNEGRHISLESYSSMDLKTEMPSLLEGFSFSNKLIQDSTFISSWYVGESESEAMWNAFIPSNEFGVAIKTTYKQLLSSIKEKSQIPMIGSLLEYNTLAHSHLEALDNVSPYSYKNQKYDYESELRLIVIDPSRSIEKEGGLKMEVSLKEFVPEVIFSPLTPEWIIETYRKFFLQVGIDPKISASTC